MNDHELVGTAAAAAVARPAAGGDARRGASSWSSSLPLVDISLTVLDTDTNPVPGPGRIVRGW
ncbi:hypothetical protein F8O01_15940 [Pseudoclavibacter chungangensis]|uniref:Uncharacterized protein n=1 Tax=Pseudoclavibacter chungangensis TaxID=587635 RepID=A0A7J5BMV8_9MICO|nr:hypothetical protein F8O01_15940 [Pseudoclavibacter chungangensis]